MTQDPKNLARLPRRSSVSIVYLALFLLAGCAEINRPAVEPFYAVTVPPPRQELRWSNGKIPKTLDPARASAAPETDVVRAIYEGLTDLDGRTLEATPGVAEKWEGSADNKIWTFTLRKDARWSNGERVVAQDFVRSWKRLATRSDRPANRYLFQNIVGFQDQSAPGDQLDDPGDLLRPQVDIQGNSSANHSNIAVGQEPPETANSNTAVAPIAVPAPKKSARTPAQFGAVAIDDVTLQVTLELPDKDFPKLVASPIFRPVYGDGALVEREKLDAAVITNGPFSISSVANDGIILARADTYWNRRSVALEGVHFVAAASAESALDAYKKGEIDVLSNAAFEPLALKLLSPYEDFRRTAHSALNFYEFNTSRAPFSDRRIREALSIAIDRTKLTDGELEGIVQPANGFDPLANKKVNDVSFDAAKAKELLVKAGYPGGAGFPAIRLVINRNETQQRVARLVARMWKQNLNLETTIIVKDLSELDDARAAGDFDLIRRGVVLPSNDEIVNMASIFGSAEKNVGEVSVEGKPPESAMDTKRSRVTGPSDQEIDENATSDTDERKQLDARKTMTAEDAAFEMKAIPLYFPTSYTLVKPYVKGFEINGLDATSLKDASIDVSWQPKGPHRNQ